MTPGDRFLIAPELIVIDFVDAAIVALERALLVEHPLVHAPPPTEHPPVRHLARTILRHAARLRRALRDYRHVVHDILRDAQMPDLPF